MKFSSKPLKTIWTWSMLTVAAFIYALSFVWCYQPNQIAFGGITGLAQVINALFPFIPVGTTVIVLNIPLFLLGWKLLGGHLLVSSLFSMAISSVFIDAINLIYTFPPMEPMLAAIFGGVVLGASLGLVFLQGATTGGTDLLARLLKLKLAWLPMGKLLLAVDLVIIAIAAIVFKSLNSALYGIVSLYISTLVMDGVLYGLDTSKVAYIISDHYDAIAKAILDFERGVTVLQASGGWSGEEKKVSMIFDGSL